MHISSVVAGGAGSSRARAADVDLHTCTSECRPLVRVGAMFKKWKQEHRYLMNNPSAQQSLSISKNYKDQ